MARIHWRLGSAPEEPQEPTINGIPFRRAPSSSSVMAALTPILEAPGTPVANALGPPSVLPESAPMKCGFFARPASNEWGGKLSPCCRPAIDKTLISRIICLLHLFFNGH